MLFVPFEVALFCLVFGALFLIWIVLPPREGETDLGSRIRGLFRRGQAARRGK